ncbi:hypothetical protein Acsp05_71560 [Actinokineospora sp. NBRC 105648]|nr:hypothetical protein Acsp05_71560 [Actinokineospora sp. NBRC 105648]
MAEVGGLGEAAEAVLRLRAEHARLTRQVAEAEEEFVRRVAAAHAANQLGRAGMAAAYELVRAWGTTNGTGGPDRWAARIGRGETAMARSTRSTPNGADGASWEGHTGWEGLRGSPHPPVGAHVAYALFGPDKAPVHIGWTARFLPRVKALHVEGLVWASWLARLCATRRDCIDAKQDLVDLYGLPGATPVNHPETTNPAPPPAK